MRIKTIVLLFLLLFYNCTSPTKTIKDVTYQSYGFANSEEYKNENILYKPNWWNITLGIVFIETIIVPIYVFGFDCFKPVGENSKIKGQILGEEK